MLVATSVIFLERIFFFSIRSTDGLFVCTAKGEAQSAASGYFTSVLAKAAESSSEPATVCIETDKQYAQFSFPSACHALR